MTVLRFQAVQGVIERDLIAHIPVGAFNALSAPSPGRMLDIDVDADGVDDCIEYMQSKGFALFATDPSDSLDTDAVAGLPAHAHDASDLTTGTLDDARVSASNITQHVGALVHQSLSGAGSNTHAQIDAHIADTGNPHGTTAAQVGAAEAVHAHAASDVTSGTFADARIAASSVTQHVGSLAHQSLSGAGANTHAQIDAHIADDTNPHATTAAQVGAAPIMHGHDAADLVVGTLDNARVAASNVTQHVGSLVHQSLSGAGTNTHAQIDTHIASVANPHATTAAQVGAAATSHAHAAADVASGTFGDARIAASNVTQHVGSLVHQSLSGAGTNTHAQIDTHIADTGNPHATTAAQVGAAATSHAHAAADTTSGTFADARIAASNVTQHVGSLAHQSLSGAGTNTHAQIDTHIASVANPHATTAAQVGAAATSHAHPASDTTSGTFADARIAASNVTQHVGSLVHQSLSGAGTNTHAQIDTHIANTGNPHATSIANVGGGTLAQLNAAISDADVPALAGQIGGTAAAPDVRGLRETSGPTLMTMGAVADGSTPRRVGTTFVGRDSRRLRKTGDQTVSSTTPVDCTSLVFTALKATTSYWYRFTLFYSAAATTTGLKIAVHYTGTNTDIKYGSLVPTSATAAEFKGANTDAQQATAANSTTTINRAVVEGTIVTNSAGDLSIQIGTEVAANVTVSAGSFGFLEEV